jgi:hypothetical protein
LKEGIDGKCRLRKQYEETIGHLTSVSSILTNKEYLMKHDKFCEHLHYSIWKDFGIETTHKLYTHTQKTVCEQKDVTVWWN